MRIVAAAFASVSLLALAATAPALAEPPVAYVEAPRPDDPLRKAVEAQMENLRAAIRSGQQRAWLDDLADLYEARDWRPIWLGAGGTEAAKAAAAEIARADEWGLDAKDFRLPDMTAFAAGDARRAEAELQMSMAVMTYVAHARGHRVDPSQLSKWLDQRPRPVEAAEVALLADAADPAAALRLQHPQHPQFERLRQAYLKLRGGAVAAPAAPAGPRVPASGPRLKLGSEHPDVAIIRTRLGVEAADADDAETFDRRVADAVRGFQRKAGLKATGVVNDSVRQALNDQRTGTGKTQRGAPSEAKKILVNMERWRWMPESLGSLYVWNNLPEFETRVIKQGRVIHQERIIIGKPETQTPIFSDKMRFVVFQPDWGIPNSIKITDLLPRLRAGDTGVLERRGMKVATASGRLVSGSSIDWSRTDIREVAIIQQPGAANPLGQVKFMFPNKHDVYMHDTPAKHLFNSAVRTYSHGCIRVRNPRALADLVFAEDRGWSQTQVGTLLSSASKPNNRVDLTRSVDVHNTYFTLVADESGALRSLPDIYGHDRRIALALDGTPASVIARDDPAVRQEQSVRAKQQQLAQAGRQQREADTRPVQRIPTRQWSPFYGLGFN